MLTDKEVDDAIIFATHARDANCASMVGTQLSLGVVATFASQAMEMDLIIAAFEELQELRKKTTGHSSGV